MKKVLLIDDEKDFCMFLKKNLEIRGGYTVLIANSGKDGIAAAVHNRPDLILLDIIMPGLSGFDVLKELKEREETTAIPVIMLTAVNKDEAKERALELYNEDYIIKPVLLSDLEAKIKDVLSRRF